MSACHPWSAAPRRQHGASLVEALVAALVLGLGVLAMARTHPPLALGAEVARQQAEASRLAGTESERLRDLSRTSEPAAFRAALADSSSRDHAGAAATYGIGGTATASAEGETVATRVAVRWADRTGASREVALSALLRPTDPRHSAALGLAHPGTAGVSPFGRSLAVPLTARRLGPDTSVFKPLAGGTTAWIVENATGALVAACSVEARWTDADLVAERLRGCEPATGRLLSGHVKVSWRLPPDPAGDDSPLGVHVGLASDGLPASAAPPCVSETLRTVSRREGGRTTRAVVPLDVLPASLGTGAWSDTGERFVAYRCIVPLAFAARAPGAVRVSVVQSSADTGAPAHRVCQPAHAERRSGTADLIASSASAATVHLAAGGAPVDRPASGISTDRPARAASADPLPSGTAQDPAIRLSWQQNFLLVRAEATCPTGMRPVAPA